MHLPTPTTSLGAPFVLHFASNTKCKFKGRYGKAGSRYKYACLYVVSARWLEKIVC